MEKIFKDQEKLNNIVKYVEIEFYKSPYDFMKKYVKQTNLFDFLSYYYHLYILNYIKNDEITIKEENEDINVFFTDITKQNYFQKN